MHGHAGAVPPFLGLSTPTCPTPYAGETDWVAAMATVACELHSAFEFYHWTGFYRSLQPPALGAAAAGAAGAAGVAEPAAGSSSFAAAGSGAGQAADRGLLVIGPYQGSLGCLRIPFRWVSPWRHHPRVYAPLEALQAMCVPTQPARVPSPSPCSKGVCGTAARTRQTQLVPDVHAFPGHIACASSTQVRPTHPLLHTSVDTPAAGRAAAAAGVRAGCLVEGPPASGCSPCCCSQRWLSPC